MPALTPRQLEHLLALQKNQPKTPVTGPDPVLAELFALLCRTGALDEYTFQPGEILFQEGDGGSNMVLIQSGHVAILKGDLDAPMVLTHRLSGEIIGEMALLEDQPRSATVVALDTVQTLSVERPALRKLLGEHPELAMSLMSTLSARLRSSDNDLDSVTRVEEQLNAELEFAAQIQARLLPRSIPDLAGWDLAATLIPARKTSGDYYDFIPLGEGRLGILIADVVDKGTGAALYMAVSRTLIRTFARQFPDAPEEALRMTNLRALEDAGSDQFVTIFYGVLDAAGTLTYANGGHNPAYVLRAQTESYQELGKTGIPIGIFEEVSWRRGTVQLQPGDTLVLYTDGVNEARDIRRGEFGTARLLETIQAHQHGTAPDLLDALVQTLRQFMGAAPQFDDITLLVAQRTG